MSFQWVYSKPKNEQIVISLQNELGVSPIIAHLLSLRKIDSFNKAKTFFRADISHLHDPFLMKDMGKAANRVAAAIRGHEKILIYGDYDVDGTTAAATLFLFLREFGVDVQTYIPHRFKEGYGINQEAVQRAVNQNIDLMISVDCGITAVKEAKTARDNGLDLIICDHHNTGPQLPDAVAVLNPKRDDCSYPFDGLSGAGVGFKLVQAVTQVLGLTSTLPLQYLDLVAISTASDIVPIIDENRILMREGLKKLNTDPCVGLKALLDVIGMSPGHISTSNIVFSIGPRINAAGRMGDANKAVKLLIADSAAEAKARTHELESINILRRDTDSRITEEAHEKINAEYNLDQSPVVILHDENWHLGVIGIVASRLIDSYHRPTIMLSTVDGLLKGSARSIKGFDIYDAISNCADLLEEFGGHEFAAGLSLKPKNLEAFKIRLNEIVANTLAPEQIQPEIAVDCQLDLSSINTRFWKLLRQFKPFGPENLRPVFVCKNVKTVGIPTIVGNGHLKLKLRQNGSGIFDAIGFNMHKYLPQVRNSKERGMQIAYNLEENHWNGNRTLQVKLLDIHFNEGTAV